MEIIKALLLGFTVGISAAIVPGPMMFATIGISIKEGWRAGPSVFIGHILVEFAMFLLILVGVSSFIGHTVMSYLAIIGGLIMILFGLFMAKSAKEISTMDISNPVSRLNLSLNPISAGVFSSALNPYYVIWWLTAGAAIVMHEYLMGILTLAAFIVGHWIADLGFLVAVSSSFSRGKDLISQNTYKKVIYFCGGFMMLFGVWFLVNYNNLSVVV